MRGSSLTAIASAFDLAEDEMDIPQLLEVDDVIRFPDDKSVITYCMEFLYYEQKHAKLLKGLTRTLEKAWKGRGRFPAAAVADGAVARRSRRPPTPCWSSRSGANRAFVAVGRVTQPLQGVGGAAAQAAGAAASASGKCAKAPRFV